MARRSGLYRAGGNWEGRRKANQHTENPGWIPGDHWVECQRCGFDIRNSNARKEWTGAIVCEGCFDFRQPQDFVRGRTDVIAAQGLVRPPRPESFTTGVTTTGSTEVPEGTFPVTISTVEGPSAVDQENDTNDVVSLDTTAWFNNPDSETITYTLVVGSTLPTGLSFSSGTISGTVTWGPSTLYSDIKVQGSYATSGLIATAVFNWQINQVGTAPDGITGLTDAAWWDFSHTATVGSTGGMWANTGRTTPAISGSNAKVVDDKSGYAHHATVVGDGPIWTESLISGQGAATFSNSGPASGYMNNTDNIAVNEPATSMFLVLQVDTTNNTGVAFSAQGDGAGAHVDFWSFESTASKRFYRLQEFSAANVSTTTRKWVNVVDRYLWFYFEFDQTDSNAYIDNSIEESSGPPWPDSVGFSGPFNLGGASTGAVYSGNILEIGLFDKKLSAAERTSLWDYHNNKYGLDAQ